MDMSTTMTTSMVKATITTSSGTEPELPTGRASRLDLMMYRFPVRPLSAAC